MSESAYFSAKDELGFIGACLIGNVDTASDAVAQVNPSMLISEEAQSVLEVITSLAKENKSGDLDSVSRAWKRLRPTERIPAVWMAQAMDSCPSPENLAYYIAGIKEAHQRRRLRDTAAKLTADTANPTLQIETILANLEAGIVIEDAAIPTSNTATDVARQFIEATEDRWKRNGELSGIPTGIPRLDSMTDGLQLGEMTLIAARPSIGKTAMATSIAAVACIERKVPTLLVTCEMSEKALMRRLVATVASVPMQAIKTGQLNQSQMSKMASAVARISASPLHFLDLSSSAKIGTITATIRRSARKHGVKLVILDYLQKVHASGKYEKRTYEVAEVSGALKACAVSTQTAMLCLAQLNRESEKEKGRKPRLSDLADSGQIERDADTVCLLDRNRSDAKGQAQIIIGKQRDGECGVIDLFYDGQFCRFEPALLQDM